MDKILLKMFKKYFVYKIHSEWKDELSKIDEKHLKEWMDDDLLSKMDYVAEDLLKIVRGEMKDKWEYELYYDISNFVEDWKHDQQAKEQKEEEIWNTDEKNIMICAEGDKDNHGCGKCTHIFPHMHDDACDEGCDIQGTHQKCEPWREEDNLEKEVIETGGI